MKLYLIFLLINVIFCDGDPKMVFPKPSKLTTAFSDRAINRPQFHFTPQFGWMNDPNGLWYDDDKEVYHLYYQYNPADTVWSLPLFWGHATSSDLIKWEDAENPLPIGPVKMDGNKYKTENDEDDNPISTEVDEESGAYSGSIFFDDGNQSGWFTNKASDSTNKNIVAAWTYNYPKYEKQWLSYSLDNGNYFYNPLNGSVALNPVTDSTFESPHFRDPQVIKLLNDFKETEEDGKKKIEYTYLMTVAKPQEYKIFFYTSRDLKVWTKQKDLELEGFLGYQYECPNLVHLCGTNLEGDKFVTKYEESYWILFISINPGSINGGSSTWYLIGQFTKGEGTEYSFIPTYHYPAPLDYGKDFYAMQLIYNSGTQENGKFCYESITGIAWASNWQYTGVVPTDPWRSSMSLARTVSLGKFNSSPERDILFLKSVAVENGHFENKVDHVVEELSLNQDVKHDYTISNSEGSFKFEIEFKVNSKAFNNTYPGHFNIELICSKDISEYLLLGYESGATAFYVDRSHSNVEWVHKNPYFSDKISVNLIPYPKVDENDIFNHFKVIGYVDRNIIELFFNDGFQTMTNTFFFTGGNFIDKIILSADYGKGGFVVKSLKTYLYQAVVNDNA